MIRVFAFRRAPFLAAAILLLCASGSRPAGPPRSATDEVVGIASRGRDPLGLVRTTTPPRLWILLDTSISMRLRERHSTSSRLTSAVSVIRWAARAFVSDAGEPLVDWRLATFRRLGSSAARHQACRDPHLGAGLPLGSPPGPPTSAHVQCAAMAIRAGSGGCDLARSRSAMLRALPSEVNSGSTPAGVALNQLAAHIADQATADLAPGQRNIILFLTDGEDTCECNDLVWKDFSAGPPGVDLKRPVELRTLSGSPAPTVAAPDQKDTNRAYNAGLKARAANLALNLGDLSSRLGEIHIVGFAMRSARLRGLTNHLAWMASDLTRPALHADDREGLRAAFHAIVEEVTLPHGPVKLAEPRLAAVKEAVAVLAGGSGRDLVAAPSDPSAFAEVLARRRERQDNVLFTTSADLRRLEATLRALAVSEDGDVAASAMWDAGELLAKRHPDDRSLWFHRRGETALRPFTVDDVRPEDLGVGAGYLSALDGAGARSAADAAEIVVRLVRGEEIEVHPETGSIYGPDDRLTFVGGPGSPKLRESLASPAVVGAPPRRQGAGPAWERFYRSRVNRRTMVYWPTNGGMLHAFSAETGEEAFAFIPADVVGPGTGTAAGAGPFLRDLALARVRDAPGLKRPLVGRFSLSGSPVVRDLPLGGGEWATVLAFGRSFGGRYVTALDVTGVGGAWNGHSEPPWRWPAEAQRPRLLWNLGPDATGLGRLRETPEPLLAPIGAGSEAEWVVLQSGGEGAGNGGASVFLLSPSDGRLRREFRIASAPGAAITRNGVPSAPVEWDPTWASPAGGPGAFYVADLHGQIHRLRATPGGGFDFRRVHSLGGRHPIHARPVAFPFPGRTEPHLLVVSGGDRRLPGGPAHMVLLRDVGDRMEEVWRKPLPTGESPDGRPVVRTDAVGVEVILPTRTTESSSAIGCGGQRSEVGISRLRAFNGVTGAPLAGVVAGAASFLDFGRGRVRGVSLSSTGNLAFSVTEAAGGVLDAVIGDFRFRIRDSALEPITLFVEGFRRSPF